ncbi:MAG TPA: lipoyl synthase [Thermodesulfobacteriota bacterium]|nr:lipoyl synthase [Deltaproteobacteria bacterium]HNR14026.1 lipoyl synthase [Thermodesulfobacteriota bacterium]HNU70464.1 lipoyl synthase [Thermodesulfobacteriota bacterium]HQO77802.1 lipoyl synthase [Thermodesulfobacteriota bacterium]
MAKPDIQNSTLPRPPWLKTRLLYGEDFQRVSSILDHWKLKTVCREAACPNIGDCFNRQTATFLILGEVCTRLCSFCNVTKGAPVPPDPSEPQRLACAVQELGLRYVVVTSVTRDDLPDGGAAAFARTVHQVRQTSPAAIVEVLIPDLQGSIESLRVIVDEGPQVLGHNLETVPRLYPAVRSRADYGRSLAVLRNAKRVSPLITKTGIMLGLGESWEEILKTLDDVAGAGCDVVTIGQYLAPTRKHHPIQRYYAPEEFDELARQGTQRGIRWVESGPMVRSSFHAQQQWKNLHGFLCGSSKLE